MPSQSKETYYLGVYWGARQETCESCAERIYEALRDLSALDAHLSRWFRLGSSRNEALRQEVPIDSQPIKDLMAQGWYRRDTDKKPIESLGFRLSLWNGAALDGEAVSVSFGCGIFAKNVDNVVSLSLRADDMINFEMSRKVLLILVKHFSPDWGVVNSHSITRETLGLQEDSPQVGWLTYLANRIGRIPPSPYYECEQVNHSGTLVISTREKFTSSNERHMASVAAVAATVSRLF
jgi:hypothetical protein